MVPRLIALLAVVLIVVGDKTPPAVTWKAVRCYGAGYYILDENDKELTANLNSAHAVSWANTEAKKRKLRVMINYFEEGEKGLERTDPWGPKFLPYGNDDD
jgi:hypothetical protein